VLHIRATQEPASCVHQSVRQKGNVEAELSANFVNGFFFTRQKVEEQRADSLRLEFLRNVPISRAVPTAPAAMRKKYDSGRFSRKS